MRVTHQTMKASAIFLVFCLGLAGYGPGHAGVAPSGETVYRATRAEDGVQHVRMEGGAYFFKPKPGDREVRMCRSS
jgi:hypothetical protein